MSKINDHAVTEKNRVEHLCVDGELTAGELERLGRKAGWPESPSVHGRQTKRSAGHRSLMEKDHEQPHIVRCRNNEQANTRTNDG